MGNVSSRQEDGSLLFLRDQDRFAVTNIKITTAHNRVLYNIFPNNFPATRYTVQRDAYDEGIVEYIQDQDTQGVNGAPNFLLKLSNDEELFFYFTFAIRQGPTLADNSDASSGTSTTATDTVINNLTFIFAPTPKDLNALTTREFNADPNIHRNPNVDLVGDYSTGGRPIEQFEWSWKWRPPRKDEDKGGGWRNACSFVEYDQRAHRLNTLVTFSFWVHNTARMLSQPRFLSPRLEAPGIVRPRVASSQSIDSRMSDSDTDMSSKDVREPSSPTIQAIPEHAAMLEPALSPLSTSATNSVKVDYMAPRAGDDMSVVDDGPVFRSTMKQLEGRTGSMKLRMKSVLERAKVAKDAQAVSNQALANFTRALREASTSNANAVQPALDNYFEKIAAEILRYEEKNVELLQNFIIDPLAKIYRNDIKQVETKKESFEKESKDYYAYVSRYLGQRSSSLKEKHKVEQDDKYQNKRKTFELKRFDYSSFMQDLHGGRKDQEVLSHLTRYAEAQANGYLATSKKIEEMMPALKALCVEVNEVDKEYQLMRTGREEKRRALEKGDKIYAEPDNAMANGARSETEANTVQPASVLSRYEGPKSPPLRSIPNELTSLPVPPPSQPATLTSSPASTRESRKSELHQPHESSETAQAIKKEGLLWSLSRPGAHSSVDPRGLSKQQWHKFWIVLDQGRLSEYVNWKQNLEPHMEPIDLRMASVREARSAERRFCFEVITPNFTRVYQATGEDDMRSWIQAINNALQSAFEGGRGAVHVTRSGSGRSDGKIARDLFGKSSSYHGHRSSSSHAYLGSKNVHRHATVGDRPPSAAREHSEERLAKLLQTIQAADAGNRWCADCGSDARVEWVSINLGIVVCIECSGMHRSLGTHISKIRSLTLDTTSFTQDIVEILLAVGNRVSNMVWEAKLDQTTKPTVRSPRDQRLAFITRKYVERAYVDVPAGASGAASSASSASDDALLMSIKRNDIQHVLHALAQSANPNVTDRSRGTHSIFLALAAADPAAPGSGAASPATSSTHLPNPQSSSSSERKAFPIAELLVQNGANVPDRAASPIPLSADAVRYLEFKEAQRAGLHLAPRTAGAGGPSSGTLGVAPAAVSSTAATAPTVDGSINLQPAPPTSELADRRARDKLVKRTSVGGFYGAAASRLGKSPSTAGGGGGGAGGSGGGGP